MSLVMAQFSQLNKEGVSILFTHHHRKQVAGSFSHSSQSLRGSSDILAAVDCHLTVEKSRDEETLIVRQEKLRTAPAIEPFRIAISKIDNGLRFTYLGPQGSKKPKKEDAKEMIVGSLSEQKHLFREDIQSKLTGSGIAGKQATDEAIKDLLEDRIIELVPIGELASEDRKKHCYKLVDALSQLPTTIGNQENGK